MLEHPRAHETPEVMARSKQRQAGLLKALAGPAFTPDAQMLATADALAWEAAEKTRERDERRREESLCRDDDEHHPPERAPIRGDGEYAYGNRYTGRRQ